MEHNEFPISMHWKNSDLHKERFFNNEIILFEMSIFGDATNSFNEMEIIG